MYTSGRDVAVTGMPAFRADDCSGPAPLMKCVVTLFLGAKLLDKLGEANTFLALNLVSRHGLESSRAGEAKTGTCEEGT